MEKKTGKIIRISLTGPESTGKTSLAAELAAHYNTIWVPEFSRKYLDERGGFYTEDDLLVIARGQRKAERNLIEQANHFLFCDTDMFVMKIWAMQKYGHVPEKIEKWTREEAHDLYLLCYPDLQWESDPLRENPTGGIHFFQAFEEELQKVGVEYAIISGKGNDRSNCAIEAVEKRFSSPIH